MHKNYLFIILILALFSCGDNTSFTPTPTAPEEPEAEPISFENCLADRSAQTLEVATWNIEQFPKVETSFDIVKQMIEQYDLDVIALQEMTSVSEFEDLVNALEGWEGYITQVNNSNLMLAYLYKTAEVTVSGSPVNLYNEDTDEYNNAFTSFRRPYLMQVTHFSGLAVNLINVHLKCCDGSEDRRRAASQLLKQYVDDNLATEETIILGDFNDEIVDTDNVFQNFIDDADNFRFTTLDIAQGPPTGWSFRTPSLSSQIDQVLITNELFDNEISTTVIQPESCLSTYEVTVSDHRPVLIRLERD